MGIREYALIGGAALMLIMAIALKRSYERNGELEAKLEQQAEETQECADANDTNQGTIAELREKIEDMVAERASDAAERERILAERDRERAERERLADELERERQNEVLADEECREFTSLRDSDFCPAAAEQLRVRSRGPGGDADEDGAGPR